jgi:hypothetical protein
MPTEKPGSAEADQKIVNTLDALRKAGVSPLPGSPADAVARAAVARQDARTQPGAGSSSVTGAADHRIRALAPAISLRGGPGQPLLGPPDVASSRAHVESSGALAGTYTRGALSDYADVDPFRVAELQKAVETAKTPVAKREARSQLLLAKMRAVGGLPNFGQSLTNDPTTTDRSSMFGGQAGPSPAAKSVAARILSDEYGRLAVDVAKSRAAAQGREWTADDLRQALVDVDRALEERAARKQAAKSVRKGKSGPAVTVTLRQI